MKKNQYIVIADSTFAKVFKTGPEPDELSLVHAIKNPEGRKQPGELNSDRQGSSMNMMSGYHVMSGDEDSHAHDVENFAREVCDVLRKDQVEGKFTQLHLAAAPHLLGLLRKNLSSGCEKVLGKTLDKNLIRAGEPEILTQFA